MDDLLRSRSRRHSNLRRVLRRLAGPVLPVPPLQAGALGDCGRCRARVVVPVSWHELDESHRWIRLRCGECGWVRDAEDFRARRRSSP